MEGAGVCPKVWGSMDICLQFVPLWNFKLSAWFPVMSIQLSHVTHSLSPVASATLLKLQLYSLYPVCCPFVSFPYFCMQIVSTCVIALVCLVQAMLNDHFHVTSSFSGEVYILASSKSMAQSHSGKLYKLVDPKRYDQEVQFLYLGGRFECVIFFQPSCLLVLEVCS